MSSGKAQVIGPTTIAAGWAVAAITPVIRWQGWRPRLGLDIEWVDTAPGQANPESASGAWPLKINEEQR